MIDFDVHHGNGTQAILESCDRPATAPTVCLLVTSDPHLTFNRQFCSCQFVVSVRSQPLLSEDHSFVAHGSCSCRCRIPDHSSVLFFSVHLYDSARDCPNCLPETTREDTRGFGAKAVAAGVRPPAGVPVSASTRSHPSLAAVPSCGCAPSPTRH